MSSLVKKFVNIRTSSFGIGFWIWWAWSNNVLSFLEIAGKLNPPLEKDQKFQKPIYFQYLILE